MRGFVNSQKRPFFDPCGGRKTETSPKPFVVITTLDFKALDHNPVVHIDLWNALEPNYGTEG